MAVIQAHLVWTPYNAGQLQRFIATGELGQAATEAGKYNPQVMELIAKQWGG